MRYILFVFMLAFISCSKPSDKIYQWRGENRTGLFQETNLMTEWPENGPEEIWFAENLGNGYGSPTVTESQIYIAGEVDSIAVLFCLKLDGSVKWQTAFGEEWTATYRGSRSTPTVVDDLVYIGSGMGNLFCMKAETGEVVWSKDFKLDFQGEYPRFGVSESPVVDGEKIFWTPGGKEHNVVALNRFSGEIIWSCKGLGERPGYNPGNIIELPFRKLFVTFSAYHLMGIDAETGELLWTHLQENTPVEKREPGIGDTHSNNILYEDNYLYYAAGDGNGGVKLQLSEDGSEIKTVWRNENFDSYMGGVVKLGNYLYSCGTRKKDFKSLDVNSGMITDSIKTGSGAVIAADNMLYFYNYAGDISLINAVEGKMKVLSSFKIKRGTKEHFSHPVIKNGILYQRRGNTLMAFNLKENINEPGKLASFISSLF